MDNPAWWILWLCAIGLVLAWSNDEALSGLWVGLRHALRLIAWPYRCAHRRATATPGPGDRDRWTH